MPSPTTSPSPKTLFPWQVWTPLAALPLLAFGLDFGRGPFIPKHLIFALGTAAYAVSVAFFIGFSVATAIPNDGKRSFAWRLGRNLGLFALTLLCFVLQMLCAGESSAASQSSATTETQNSSLDGMGCGALCGFCGPLVLGFLLHEFAQSM